MKSENSQFIDWKVEGYATRNMLTILQVAKETNCTKHYRWKKKLRKKYDIFNIKNPGHQNEYKSCSFIYMRGKCFARCQTDTVCLCSILNSSGIRNQSGGLWYLENCGEIYDMCEQSNAKKFECMYACLIIAHSV